MKSKRLIQKICFGFMCFFCVALIAGNIVCFGVLGVDFISSALVGTGAVYGDEESARLGANLVKKISEEGSVLLKNDNKTLPLNIAKNNKVNVFGYTALDNAWVFTGVGSGSCKPDPAKRIGILKGLENSGFKYNKDIIEKYKTAIPNVNKDLWLSMNQNGKIMQPKSSFYTSQLIEDAKKFSDTAIVVLSRNSGENVGEVPATSIDYATGDVDSSRSYLDISKSEEEMLEIVKNNFDKVVVILNTTNNMQCGFLMDDKIDAALFCGPTGLCGAEGVANLLAGRRKSDEKGSEGKYELVSPSGRLADTYAYGYSSEPVFANRFVRNKTATSGNIVYQEDIYFGYRWYETADTMGYFDGLENGYNSAVIYPFGYGLSYTDFSWKLKSVSPSNGGNIDKNSKIKVEVIVKNEGDFPAKDVVELYYRAPYIKGGIEKSSICLGDFAKTSTLKAGESQIVTLNLSAYDMASYDCYDKNKNGHTGYELDQGKYTLELKSNIHKLKDMKDSSIVFNIPQTVNFDTDTTTNYPVINRFTGSDAYASIAIDGSNIGINETYLSRANFLGTFKDRQSGLPTDKAKMNKARIYATNANNQDTMPQFGVDKGLYIITKKDGSKASAEDLKDSSKLKFNDELVNELMKDVNSSKWDDLVNQVTLNEAVELVEKSGFGSAAMVSIGKTETLDFDGPSGFNENTQKPAEDKSSWTSYPPECVVGCTWSEELANELGKAIAFEANKSNISGWYAPGVNLHRSNYNGRNFEYYSEDPVISGKLAAGTIMGAKSGGLYCYLKHFALSEEGDNAKGVDTWITEQNFREVYLRPFEIAVKSGANAIMTAFNRVGPIWAGACYDLLTEILRNEWGFVGSVVTDWSNGDEIMNTTRGVLAGNDLWLNPMERNYAPLNKKDATQMYCAKKAVKNNLHTYISTYHYAKNYKPGDDPYQIEVGVRGAGNVFSWWIPALIGIDVLALAGTVVLGWFVFRPIYKKKKGIL